MKRQIRLIHSLLLGAGLLMGCKTFLADTADIRPVGLRCEYQPSPLGLDVRQPQLSWRLEAMPGARGLAQSGYRVLVAMTPERLIRDEGDLWDSGKVESDQQLHIRYAGRPLTSQLRCYWKVRVWDQNGKPSNWSEPAWWTMGLLEPDDWQGHWIAATNRLTVSRPPGLPGYHALEAKTNSEPKWVQVDLGAELPLDEVILYPPSPSGFAQVEGFGFPARFCIEVSNDPDFKQCQTLADYTQTDYPNPGNESRSFSTDDAQARFVRVTATRLWDRRSGSAPFCFALAELEVFSGGTNAALHAAVLAKDSVEDSIWGRARLTDGDRLPHSKQSALAGPGNAGVFMRKEFSVEGKVVRATAFLCGLGYSELEINGRKIGGAVLDPGFTDYSRRILYRTHDVTDAIQCGANTMGVVLGGGWFNLATPDLFGFERAPWSASPRMLGQLNIEYANGTTQRVVSDASWKWSTGAITFNCVRGGETIDAREDKPGWSLTGYDDSAWQSALVVEGPAGKRVAQQHPPIQVRESIRPVSLTEPKPGVYVFDLGVNISGWARLTTRGPRGAGVTLEYNERLNPDGTVNTGHLSSHTYGRFQTDVFILSGEGLENFEPRFTYHGFRYVQVTGLTEKPTLDTLVGRWVTTDLKPAGQFSCSNERINQLQTKIIRTLLNNMHGIPTDCPQREKMGWLHDGCVCMPTAGFNLDTPLFYRKWFQDIIDGQDANGHVPDFVPTCGWGRSKPDGSPGEMADPWWGGALVMAPWTYYLAYGDARVLEEAYPSMKSYVDYLRTTAREDIIEWGLGDWLDESAGGGRRRVPVPQTSTAAFAWLARIVSQIATLLGQDGEARQYAVLADEIHEAFNQQFLDGESGQYAADSQAAQAVPLSLGLAPEHLRQLVLDRLIENIEGPSQGHINAGIIGTPFLFQALMENGRNDLAYRVITQEDYPGWLHMMNQGATTIWEAWNGEGSRNHPTLGCVGAWFYQGLGGIRLDPSAPAFKHFLIRPAVVGDLTWVQCAYASVRGRIASNWRREREKLQLEVSIPVNTTATIYVPSTQPGAITESGRPAGMAAGVQFLRTEKNAAVYQVGSGNYVFDSPFSSDEAAPE